MTYRQLPIKGPFAGVVSDLAATQKPVNAFDDVVNFFVRKGRIQSRPLLNPFVAADATKTWRYFGSFKDANGSLHTFGLTGYTSPGTPAFMITAGPILNPLTNTAALFGPNGKAPFNIVYIQNQAYLVNNGYPLQFLDGSNAVQVAGDVPGTAKFLDINVDRLIMANTTETAFGGVTIFNFPRRVRWCGSNNPQEWNPLIDFTAGSNDILDINNDITGLTTLSEYTYVWHDDGVIVMIPTGQSLAPYDFVNFSNTEDGYGNIFPYALAKCKNRAIVVSFDDINIFDGASFTGIGGPNRKRIMSDLSSSNPSSDFVTGRYIPNFTLGFDFPCYLLTIPSAGVNWLYTFDDGQWVRFSSSFGYVTAARTVYTS